MAEYWARMHGVAARFSADLQQSELSFQVNCSAPILFRREIKV